MAQRTHTALIFGLVQISDRSAENIHRFFHDCNCQLSRSGPGRIQRTAVVRPLGWRAFSIRRVAPFPKWTDQYPWSPSLGCASYLVRILGGMARDASQFAEPFSGISVDAWRVYFGLLDRAVTCWAIHTITATAASMAAVARIACNASSLPTLATDRLWLAPLKRPL